MSSLEVHSITTNGAPIYNTHLSAKNSCSAILSSILYRLRRSKQYSLFLHRPTFEMATTIPSSLQYLSSGQYSDFEIECEGHIFKVHKIILAGASPWFKALFDSGFKESRENKVSLPEDEACLIIRLLMCIYSGCYKFFNLTRQTRFAPPFGNMVDNYMRNRTHNKDIKRTELALRLYQVADKYQIQPLKQSARRSLLQIATALGYHNYQPKHFADWVHLVYDSDPAPDNTLTDIIVHVAKYAVHEHEALKCETFQRLLRDVPDFRFEMASTTYTTQTPLCLKCFKCGWAVNRRCSCGELEGCRRQQCIKEREERSICLQCNSLGSLSYDS